MYGTNFTWPSKQETKLIPFLEEQPLCSTKMFVLHILKLKLEGNGQLRNADI